MRSDQIHRALAQGINRFEVCQLVSKGVRASHKTGSRFEDTINDTLEYLGNHKASRDTMYTPTGKAEDEAYTPTA